jgi:hypothetical protein
MLPILGILTSVIKAGLVATRTQLAKVWFQKIVKQAIVKKTLQRYKRPGQIIANEKRASFWRSGNMYFFKYDPKNKDRLPYYDTFPLVIPIERYKDGFLGINLHYLYPKDRAILMDQLSAFVNNDKLDESTRMIVNYNKVGDSKKFKRAKPCIKRYLDSKMGSAMILVNADDWGTALFLPVERFQKAHKSKVWRESKSIYSKF